MTQETRALIETLLAKYDCADVPGWIRQRSGVIVTYDECAAIYLDIAVSKLGRKQARFPQAPTPMPADFAARAVTTTNKDMSKHYGVHEMLCARWRRELGMAAAPRPAHAVRPLVAVPDGFALAAPTMTLRELAGRYGRGRWVIRRWCEQLGLTFKRGTPGAPYLTAPVDRPHVDCSRAGLAAEYLRRFGPVVRCRANGAYDPRGTHWRRGSTILSAADIIGRAERNGWEPDAWRRLAA